MSWEQTRAAWEDVTRSWSEGWDQVAVYAEQTYTDAIEAGTIAYEKHVKSFVEMLSAANADIEAMEALVEQLPPEEQAEADKKLAALEQRHEELAAGFYMHVEATATAEVGVAPLAIGAVGVVGVGGIAWALAAYQWATNLREQTALERAELEARVAASKEGRTLQPHTLREHADEGGVGGYVAAGLGLLGLVGAGYYFWTQR